MLKKILPLLFIGIFSIEYVYPHHIVGGDITIKQVDSVSSRYQITLTFLFDDIHGHVHSEDPEEKITIFKKGTNTKVQDFVLNKLSNNTYLPYTSSTCFVPDLKTRIILYSSTVTLLPALYSDQSGYYISWERCCRSDDINNINNPDQSGIVFYAEFPAIRKPDQKLFNNSSPSFINLKGDYACTGTSFYLDFSANDNDGDSLSYELAIPLKGYTTVMAPIADPANSAPYALVSLASGIDINNLILGDQPLSINSKSGLVYGNASTEGIYVFAVKCIEYRNGVKIGEIRRDYQFLVRGDCEHYTSPIIGMIDPVTQIPSLAPVNTITLNENTSLKLFVIDSTNTNLKVHFTLEGYGTGNIDISVTSGNVQDIYDTLFSYISWDNCLLANNTIVNATFWVEKFACPLPLTDTLYLSLDLQYSPNGVPDVIVDLPTDEISYQVNQHHSFVVRATDMDATDVLTLKLVNGNALKDDNVFFDNVTGVPDIQSELLMKPDCYVYRSMDRFNLTFITEDNSCFHNKDTAKVVVHLNQEEIELDKLNFYNLCTPNGDQFNDTFILPFFPDGNCEDYFMSIEIFNRFGSRIFFSETPVTNWNPSDNTDGVYFYSVNYSKSNYKGWLHIIR